MSENTSAKCPKCDGLGFRRVDGMEGVVKCECRSENRTARLMSAAEIPKRYVNCLLDNYVTPPSTENPYLSLALIKATGYVDEYFSHTTPRGLLFQGSPGLGK